MFHLVLVLSECTSGSILGLLRETTVSSIDREASASHQQLRIQLSLIMCRHLLHSLPTSMEAMVTSMVEHTNHQWRHLRMSGGVQNSDPGFHF